MSIVGVIESQLGKGRDVFVGEEHHNCYEIYGGLIEPGVLERLQKAGLGTIFIEGRAANPLYFKRSVWRCIEWCRANESGAVRDFFTNVAIRDLCIKATSIGIKVHFLENIADKIPPRIFQALTLDRQHELAIKDRNSKFLEKINQNKSRSRYEGYLAVMGFGHLNIRPNGRKEPYRIAFIPQTVLDENDHKPEEKAITINGFGAMIKIDYDTLAISDPTPYSCLQCLQRAWKRIWRPA